VTDAPIRLGDRYQVGHVLGRGGMAEVHIAQDLRLGRNVAVKMLRADLARDPSFQARFRREAQSAASLNHPAVVAVYDTGEDQVAGASVPYIVMEYVEGSTLRELMQAGRRLLPERALEITAGVLDALDYSHRRGIVHRDIKPANVMLTRAGDVKVMDFGIARALADTSSTMTQTSAVIGTAQYLSPEQARGEQVDARSDLYSTGCLLYELLTGRPPFIGESPVSVAYQHVREQPAPPSQLDPELPAALDALVLKSLVKDRDHRYQTAAEMRADIERALAGRQVEATVGAGATQFIAPISAPTNTVTPVPYDEDRDPPQPRRTWVYVALALAVLAVFLLIALVGQSVFGDRTKTVAVPNLQGLTVEVATERLRADGLELGETNREESETVRVGLIIRQSPEAPTSVNEGSKVDLWVSTAPDKAIVPLLEGLKREEALAALASADLQVGAVTSQDSNITAGVVIKASQAQGKEVPKGTKINLVVASGANKVPSVLGQPEGEARSALGKAGFEVVVEQRETADAAPGTVLEQRPRPGSTQRVDSEVTIVVAKAPPQQQPTPTVTVTQPTPTPTPTPTLTTPPPTTTPPPPGG